MNLLAKEKQTHTHRKQICVYQRGKAGEGKLGVWDEQIHTAVYKIDKYCYI